MFSVVSACLFTRSGASYVTSPMMPLSPLPDGPVQTYSLDNPQLTTLPSQHMGLPAPLIIQHAGVWPSAERLSCLVTHAIYLVYLSGLSIL